MLQSVEQGYFQQKSCATVPGLHSTFPQFLQKVPRIRDQTAFVGMVHSIFHSALLDFVSGLLVDNRNCIPICALLTSGDLADMDVIRQGILLKTVDISHGKRSQFQDVHNPQSLTSFL